MKAAAKVKFSRGVNVSYMMSSLSAEGMCIFLDFIEATESVAGRR